MFFRAETLQEAGVVFRSFLKWNYSDLAAIPEHFAQFGLHVNEMIVAVFFVLIVLLVECIQEYAPKMNSKFYTGMGLYRWSAAMILSLAIVLFGFYDNRQGEGARQKDAVQKQFIYEEF